MISNFVADFDTCDAMPIVKRTVMRIIADYANEPIRPNIQLAGLARYKLAERQTIPMQPARNWRDNDTVSAMLKYSLFLVLGDCHGQNSTNRNQKLPRHQDS